MAKSKQEQAIEDAANAAADQAARDAEAAELLGEDGAGNGDGSDAAASDPEPPAAVEDDAVERAPVTMYPPKDGGGASHDGEFYAVGKDGTLQVPHHAVDALRVHGYTTDAPAKAAK